MNPVGLLAVLAGLSLAGTAAVRLSGTSAQQQADAPTQQRQLLRFADGADGSLAVLQADSGALLYTAAPGHDGFMRSSLRGLVRERKRRGLGDAEPFELLARADGRLTLLDPATGRRIDLESFGATNAAVFSPTAAQEPFMSTIETAADATALAKSETLISPRFYRTDYAAMDRLDVSSIRAEWDAMLAEYEGDNNHDHFQRGPEFAAEVQQAAAAWSPQLRRDFLDFLVSSLTSEYSGCVLYNEIQKSVKNPDIKQLMRYMTRDESRHANFLNQSLKDFGLGVDLLNLKASKAYTYFKPKYIFYATYLSEKIGYARYITIYRQLERHPELRFHPIFRWFERWCNDEFRHGESFALIMRAQPALLRGANLLWVRFFLLAVYATMYVRDHTRPWLSEALGMDPTAFDYRVFDITTAISQQVFPISLDTDAPAFRAGMTKLVQCSQAIEAAKARGGLVGKLQQGWHAARAALCFVGLYLRPVKRHALPAQMRVAPSW